MRYTTFGEPSPTTIVMIHGIGMGRVVFSGLADELAEECRVITVDLPGFGDSPEPGTAANLVETAEAVAGFVAHTAAGPVVLVGHSMGTQIATEVALLMPDTVRALVLIAPTVNRHERRARTQAWRMVQDLIGESPKVLAKGLREYAKTSPRWFANKLAFMLEHHLEARTPLLNIPTLVIRGEDDPVSPSGWSAEIAGSVHGGALREIPDRGHEAVIRSPEPVASFVREFLAREMA